MKLTIATSVSFFWLVSANNAFTRQAGVGAEGLWEPGSFGTSPTAEQQQLFVAAGHQANDTSSATFNFAPGNLSASDSTWTWRINISEVAVPDTNDLHAINTQWDLQWPGGGSLQSFVARAGLAGNNSGRLCLAVAEFDLLSNVTSRYSKSDQGNCSAVLGSACAQRLQAMYLNGACDETSGILPPFVEECADIAPAAMGHGHLDPGTLIDSDFNRTTQSGDTVWYSTSPGVPASNISSPYAKAETRLNILLLREIPGVGKGTDAATMLCQVVNPSASSGARSGGLVPSLWAFGLVVAWTLLMV